ncbi:imidazole glycerol phosphate synthase subunit HisH [Lachnoclostridium sp. An131]|uniref:imidazole glycerol phosphate synthase subunit HisH n=1 Tax=Lachnoclostridium sp. An131 TaxID=1965555 RepID=UPI000B39437A|nr:imidazole glycerol phosphate synthase subunit HisH [Lachnoclostridium sp. An131]OUQ27974.1 imidazole glycerol phosphate synthase subunit HisH [Lachnoclostridium sp. An131]
MIAVINYGMGNTGSIVNMLHKIGEEAMVTDRADDLEEASKIILPGVGAFDHGIENLYEKDLVSAIRKVTAEKGTPFLGICLGMQLLGNGSEEGNAQGLGLIPFKSVRFGFNEGSGLKIPHMGWDVVKFEMEDKILEGLEGIQRYYFVHSYHAVCENPQNVLMTCDYGYQFAAAVKKNNIYGFQFHPEKSHKFGMKLLENFVRRI